MWYLSQGGQQHGPYTRPQLEQLISRGQAQGSYVGAEGQPGWVSIEQHPEFSRLLPSAAGSSPRGSRRALVWGLGILGLVLVVGIGIGLAYRLLDGPKSVLARVVPEDVTLYMEVADLPGAIEAARQMDVVDLSRLDLERHREPTVEAMTESLGIDPGTAHQVIDEIESVAFAGRTSGSHTTGAFLVGLSGAGGVDALLGSGRFERQEAVGDSGWRYRVRERDAETKDETLVRKLLDEASTSDDAEDQVLVWFHDRALLAWGDRTFIEGVAGVVDGKGKSLSEAEHWTAASFRPGAQVVIYGAPGLWNERQKARELVTRFFDGVPGITICVELEDAGVLTTIQGELRGSSLPEASLSPAPALELPRRLPASTLGYLAIPTRSELSGAEFRRATIEHLRALDDDDARKTDRAFDEMRQELGVGIEEIWDAFGDELVLAVALAPGARIRPGREVEDYLDDAALGLVLDIGDRDTMVRLVELLRREAFEDGPGAALYEVTAEGEGFVARPKGGPFPYLRVALQDDRLLVVGGGEAMVGRFVDAVAGSGPQLGDDPAHRAAIEALEPGARAQLWIDTGRVLDDLLHADEVVRMLEAIERKTGTRPIAVVLEGDERIGSAIALHLDTDGDRWRYQLQILNGTIPLGAMLGLGLLQTVDSLDELESLSGHLEELEVEPTKMKQALDALP
ncbi:MAG: DUF4339 domain-containing protein [Myxococcales bacterium]|nr:DUF4339 domain-containing protein [Myxococcales bacterium]